MDTFSGLPFCGLRFRSGVGPSTMGDLPTWVLTHRDFAPVAGVTFTAADDLDAVRRVHADMVEAARGKDVWLVGGGGLVARFVEAGLVDELWVQLAPVTLGAGAPLLPARVELRLEEVVRNGDFVCTRYAVVGPAAAPVGESPA